MFFMAFVAVFSSAWYSDSGRCLPCAARTLRKTSSTKCESALRSSTSAAPRLTIARRNAGTSRTRERTSGPHFCHRLSMKNRRKTHFGKNNAFHQPVSAVQGKKTRVQYAERGAAIGATSTIHSTPPARRQRRPSRTCEHRACSAMSSRDSAIFFGKPSDLFDPSASRKEWNAQVTLSEVSLAVL